MPAETGRRPGPGRRRRQRSGEVAGTDAQHALRDHVLPGCLEAGAAEVDAAARVLDDRRLEARGARVHGAPAHAEVRGETAEEAANDAAFLQVAGEAGAGLLVGLEEGGVAVHVPVVALAHDQRGVGNRQPGGEVGAFGALHAVVRPQHLGAVAHLDGLEGLLALVLGRERHVIGRVPVLREHHVLELAGQVVDEGDDLVALVHGQGAAGDEALLDVHDDQHVPCGGRDLLVGGGTADPAGGAETHRGTRGVFQETAAIQVTHVLSPLADDAGAATGRGRTIGLYAFRPECHPLTGRGV